MDEIIRYSISAVTNSYWSSLWSSMPALLQPSAISNPSGCTEAQPDTDNAMRIYSSLICQSMKSFTLPNVKHAPPIQKYQYFV